jgi:hypothetical protein
MGEIYRQDPPPTRDSNEEELMEQEKRQTSDQNKEKVDKKDKREESRKEKNKQKKEKSTSTEYRQKVYNIIGKSGTPLSAFLARPRHLNFETQLDGEEVILLLRRHLITQIQWVAVTLVMIFAPLVLTNFPLLRFLPSRFQFIVILMWYLLTFAIALEDFLGWYFNVYIVTDERVIDIDFYNLIYKEISDTEIENIEDVTVTVGGVLQTVFNYGSVEIQTAAQIPQLEFEYVPKPGVVSEVLKQLQLEEKQEEIEGRIM